RGLCRSSAAGTGGPRGRPRLTAMGFELVVSAIDHRYGSLSVLEDISFTLRQGEILAIVGPSGCGKSTLLGILGGLLEPTRGSVAGAGDMPADTPKPFTHTFPHFPLPPCP